MKKLLLAIPLAASLVACNVQGEKSNASSKTGYATLSGKIEANKYSKLVLQDNDRNIVSSLTVNEDGSFADTLSNIQDGYYNLMAGRKYVKVLIRDGYALELATNADNFSKEMHFDGTGKAMNNYMVSKLAQQQELAQSKNLRAIGILDQAEFTAKLDSAFSAENQLIADFANGEKLFTSELQSEAEAMLKYEYALIKEDYVPAHRYFSKDENFEVSEDFYDYRSELDLDNDELLSVPGYFSYLSKYQDNKFQEEYADKMDDNDFDYYLENLKFAADFYSSPQIKNRIVANKAKNNISYTSDLAAFYEIAKSNITDVEKMAELDEKYSKLQSIQKGNPSPVFDYESIEGNQVSLADLKGKYVYIDVWATWCGPCKREIPYLKEIESKYHDKDIAFVSISVDTDKAAWEKMVKEKELGGYQLFSDKNWKSDFVKGYQINGIPRFIMLDKEGNIISPNAPRPSNPKLEEMIGTFEL